MLIVAKSISVITLLLSLVFGNISCQRTEKVTLEVTATAYNSLPSQTHRHHPSITAWGDTLKPGMKAIAVSRDLITEGLTYGTEVTIEGLDGTYIVRDKMNMRWEKKIDIYMGINEEKAREWGVKKVKITWVKEKEDGV